MPLCITCGDHFSGLGRYCSFCRPPSNSALVKYQHHHNHHRPSELRRYDSFGYDDTTIDLHNGYPNNNLPLSQFANRNFQPTLSNLTYLTDRFAIDAVTLTTHPDRSSSMTIAANKDRIQCPTCRQWFPDQRRLQIHQWEMPSGCEIHGVCFAKDEEHFHGTSYRHDRCFVKGCGSVYRREGGWKGGVVERHVRGAHWGH